MKIYTFASSSDGNCLLIQSEKINILLDFGISYKRICAHLISIGLSITDISAIFITHEHADHIKGLQTLVKHQKIPIYCTPPTARQLAYKIAGIESSLHYFSRGTSLFLEDMKVTSFETSHDSAESADYVFRCGDHVIGCMTDTGIITDAARLALRGCELCYLESNHDIHMLQSGPYPVLLQARILSDVGHLCNDVSSSFARFLAENGCRTILLAHLSQENNDPILALKTAKQAVSEYDTQVFLAERDQLCGPFSVGE